jgi:hypothetical protein
MLVAGFGLALSFRASGFGDPVRVAHSAEEPLSVPSIAVTPQSGAKFAPFVDAIILGEPRLSHLTRKFNQKLSK